MKTYKFDDYKMTLQDTWVRDMAGKAIVEYTFSAPDGEVIFEGVDFHCSPLHEPESKDSAKALLGFLTLRKGDTDSEYFDDYTERQLEFSESFDCEQLQMYAYED